MSETTATAHLANRPRAIRYQQAALLLEKWLADESEYDEATWQHLQAELKDAAVQCEAEDENSA